MTSKGSLDIRLQGFVPANREAVVRLTNPTTGQQLERRPFLDGTLLVRDIDPGPWQMQVVHPNLISPIDTRVIRVFPQPFPTRVPVPVPPDLFRDTPIRDIPDADLAPVQQAATAARDATAPIGGKAAGEVIRAEDWNQLAGAVNALAAAVVELTSLVSPRGHDHPEIAEKIAEVQGNIRRFTESFGRSLLELRRDMESQFLRRQVLDVLATATVTEATRATLLTHVADLERATQETTPVFSRRLAGTGNILLSTVAQVAEEQPDPETWRTQPVVQTLMATAGHYAEAGVQTQPEEELGTYRRTTSAAGGSKFGVIGISG
jgi:hypothetical protein